MERKIFRAKQMDLKNTESNISSEILTRQFVATKLSFIFEDAIILDSKFNIVSVSEWSAQLFKYAPEALVGKSLNTLTKEFNLTQEIGKLLGNGYFSGHCFDLTDGNGKNIKVRLSGIYLGLFSDFNEFVILTVRDLNPTFKLVKKLKSKEAILDNLVYRASHDLRGPIATVLGLVNLAKSRKDDSEVDKLLELIATHSKVLDERLRTLVLKAVARELRVDTRF
jgi:signal transduction histidine kinase